MNLENPSPQQRHANVKQAIIDASELDTRLVMRPLRNTERVLVNPTVEKVLKLEKELGSEITFDDISNEVVGVYTGEINETSTAPY